jgi:ribosomal protein S18 acetylase RimI-like enzyme
MDVIEDGDEYEYYVWDDDLSRILAYALVEKHNGSIRIQIINVASDFRNNGIGSKLLARILEDFASFEIIAYTFEDRIAWYQRHGFEVAGKTGQLFKMIHLAS